MTAFSVKVCNLVNLYLDILKYLRNCIWSSSCSFGPTSWRVVNYSLSILSVYPDLLILILWLSLFTSKRSVMTKKLLINYLSNLSTTRHEQNCICDRSAKGHIVNCDFIAIIVWWRSVAAHLRDGKVWIRLIKFWQKQSSQLYKIHYAPFLPVIFSS